MEVLVVDFGCSYERSVVGVARDPAEARSIAREWLSRRGRPALEFEYFAVQRHVFGVPGESILDWADLDLDAED